MHEKENQEWFLSSLPSGNLVEERKKKMQQTGRFPPKNLNFGKKKELEQNQAEHGH